MALYTRPTEPATHVVRTDATGRRVGRGRYRRATDVAREALRAVSCRSINHASLGKRHLGNTWSGFPGS